MAGGGGSRAVIGTHTRAYLCSPTDTSSPRCSSRGWLGLTVLLGCVSSLFFVPRPSTLSHFSHLRVTTPMKGIQPYPAWLTRSPGRVLPPLSPLVTHTVELSGNRGRVLTFDPSSGVPRPSNGLPILTAFVAFVSAAISTNTVHLQDAVETLRAVFAGAGGSLLHEGPPLLSEQQELLVNLIASFLACSVSVTLTYPVDTLKTRLQSRGGRSKASDNVGLYKGLVPSLLTICPSASLFVAASYGVKRFLLTVPGGPTPLVASLISGALCNAVLSLYRVPTDMLVKLLQTDVCRTVPEALRRIFLSPGAGRILFSIWTIVILKSIPNGALKIATYEFFDIFLTTSFASWGLSRFTKSMVCGAFSGMTIGFLTTPIDVVMTRIMTQVHEKTHHSHTTNEPAPRIDGVSLVRETCAEIHAERGLAGFFTGALLRASYYAPSSCSFFAVFESLKIALCRAIAPS
eukprot:TRINITY_DN3213_c0_g1_i1.p1 TRINITY_DN3213_c0_g1~~TRINITY_DN3213_c0_g1_i1.p1  ORF type:complete len:468 (-),score=24.92 TRINITY_DN3213_c0_g1_i1:132-1511(-)